MLPDIGTVTDRFGVDSVLFSRETPLQGLN